MLCVLCVVVCFVCVCVCVCVPRGCLCCVAVFVRDVVFWCGACVGMTIGVENVWCVVCMCRKSEGRPPSLECDADIVTSLF